MRAGEEGPEHRRTGGRAPRPAALPSGLWVIPQECWPGGGDRRASRVHGAVRPGGSGCVCGTLTGPGDPVREGFLRNGGESVVCDPVLKGWRALHPRAVWPPAGGRGRGFRWPASLTYGVFLCRLGIQFEERMSAAQLVLAPLF